MNESSVVLNIVWAGEVFTHLRYFVASQMAHSSARFRFVVNCCPPEEVARIGAFADAHPDRVVEVVVVSDERMITHGEALDEILRTRDDGPYFALIDSDICVNGPFLPEVLGRLDAGAVGVGGGRGVWCRSDVIPDGHPGVNGEYFFDADGFFFGSPHFSIYRRAELVATIERWGIGFFAELQDEAKEALVAAGHDYWLWDTGKLVNTFLQIDGHEVVHHEPAALMHIGGMTHYLSPPEAGTSALLAVGVDRSTWNPDRLEVADFCASVLVAAGAGEGPPEVPDGLDETTESSLRRVRATIIDLVATYG